MPSCSRWALAFGAYLAVTTTAAPPRSVTAVTASAAPGMATVRGIDQLGRQRAVPGDQRVDGGLVEVVAHELVPQRRSQPGDERAARPAGSRISAARTSKTSTIPGAGIDQGHVEVEADGEAHQGRVSAGLRPEGCPWRHRGPTVTQLLLDVHHR